MRYLREMDVLDEKVNIHLTRMQFIHLEALLSILSDPENINSYGTKMKDVISDDAKYLHDYIFLEKKNKYAKN